MFTKISKRLTLIGHTVRRLPAGRLRRQWKRDADVVVWIHHRYPDSWLSYLTHGDSFLKDVALLRAVLDAGHDVRFRFGTKVDAESDATIVYSIDAYNPDRLTDYSASLVAALRSLEAKGNRLFPSADEAEYWENKVFMHRRFGELGINCPPTVAIDRDSSLDTVLADASFGFPMLVKEPHSNNSKGLHKVDDRAALDAVRAELATRGLHELLLQGLIEMRRDLRVTMVGGEVVHHYWRINQSDEWMPTTTRKGSSVDFVTFPEQWRTTIEKAMASLELRNGAFDICWAGDDLDTEPIFLEVSPSYSPNPTPPPAFADRPYSDFKANLFGSDSFPGAFADIVVELHHRLVAAWGDELRSR